MKTNYELVREILSEINKDYGYDKLDGFCILGTEAGDTLYVGFGAECIAKTNEELLEEYENPFEIFIHDFYTYNEKAQSKETAKCYERYLKKKFKEILKSDNDDEILCLVKESKRVKAELDALKDNLEWTKEVAKLLYYAKELWFIKIEEEEI